MQSWVIYHVALKRLPPGKLQKIYRRSARLVNYWAADPRYCEETKRNPIDRIQVMLEELDLAGAGDYARAAIDYMAAPLGGHFAFKERAISDKGTIEGEAADITIALGKFVDEVREALADDDISTVERIKIKECAVDVKRQVDELMNAAGFDD